MFFVLFVCFLELCCCLFGCFLFLFFGVVLLVFFFFFFLEIPIPDEGLGRNGIIKNRFSHVFVRFEFNFI